MVWSTTSVRRKQIHEDTLKNSANSSIDAAGKFATSLIFGSVLPVGGTWNQWFMAAHKDLPAASSIDLKQRSRSRTASVE
jgi:hypothetical protein